MLLMARLDLSFQEDGFRVDQQGKKACQFPRSFSCAVKICPEARDIFYASWLHLLRLGASLLSHMNSRQLQSPAEVLDRNESGTVSLEAGLQ